MKYFGIMAMTFTSIVCYDVLVKGEIILLFTYLLCIWWIKIAFVDGKIFDGDAK